MKTLRRVLSFAAAAVSILVCACPAHAIDPLFFGSNADISAALTGYGVVGFANMNDYTFRVNPASPTVNLLASGSISNYLNVYNSSLVNISGGIGFNLQAFDTSAVNLNGGMIGSDVFAYNNSTITINSGLVSSQLVTIGDGTINLRGGSISGFSGNILYARDRGEFNLYGTGLSTTLLDPNSSGGMFSLYALSGTLSDGNSITGKTLYIQNNSGARFTLNNAAVPEPNSLALLVGMGVSGACFLARRLRR